MRKRRCRQMARSVEQSRKKFINTLHLTPYSDADIRRLRVNCGPLIGFSLFVSTTVRADEAPSDKSSK
jgi:hypothetical protein